MSGVAALRRRARRLREDQNGSVTAFVVSIVIAVLREMVLIAAIATVIALPSIGLLARYFRSQLYGVPVYDPITLAASTALIIVMVLVAAALPARRAAGVQPMQALRTE